MNSLFVSSGLWKTSISLISLFRHSLNIVIKAKNSFSSLSFSLTHFSLLFWYNKFILPKGCVCNTYKGISKQLTIRQEALDRRLNEIKCTRFTFHAFRHTHASLLLNAGISYKELQYWLGHATLVWLWIFIVTSLLIKKKKQFLTMKKL